MRTVQIDSDAEIWKFSRMGHDLQPPLIGSAGSSAQPVNCHHPARSVASESWKEPVFLSKNGACGHHIDIVMTSVIVQLANMLFYRTWHRWLGPDETTGQYLDTFLTSQEVVKITEIAELTEIIRISEITEIMHIAGLFDIRIVGLGPKVGP
jgi:hypothetical protein